MRTFFNDRTSERFQVPEDIKKGPRKRAGGQAGGESQDLELKTRDTDHVIERLAYSGLVLPSAEWHTLRHPGVRAQLAYRVRVTCAANYYGPSCWSLCKPRDDRFGHYRCSPEGRKVCRPGWTGSTCESPVCRRGCHPVHGYCDRPGQCLCRPGWKSELCDHCQPYPGCRHGYCNNTPWQCICDVNWGGILCDQDLNYCGTHEPCFNGATCEHTIGQDKYLCRCRQGFFGRNCELGQGQAQRPCLASPCLNGGTCSERNSTFECACLPGWTGNRCQKNVNECSSSPCLHGGTCLDLVAGYRCLCQPGWRGSSCETPDDTQASPAKHSGAPDRETPSPCAACPKGSRCVLGPRSQVQHYINDCATRPCVNGGTAWTAEQLPLPLPDGWEDLLHNNRNECHPNPCHNDGKCTDLIADFLCECQGQWKGKTCNLNINDCATRPCVNGGTCVDGLNSYRCLCPDGWEGPHCSNRDSHCDSSTCLNGGTCEDLGDAFVCHCPENYQGHTCQIAKGSSCESNPCQNGATCVNRGHSFSCICREGFEGRLCQQNVDDCRGQPCHNGGRCIDGVNWFRCECASGFAGPDCRINVDECASSPCAVGSTCQDAIGDYFCSCPPGRTGKRCNVGTVYPEGSRWQLDCTLCSCTSGSVTCSPGPCPESGCDPVGSTGQCPLGQTCLARAPEACFVNPCPTGGPRGDCSDVANASHAAKPSQCLPNSADPSNNCAKMTLLFDRRTMTPGTTVESLCNGVRQLSPRPSILILCAQRMADPDSIEVTLSMPGHASASTYAAVSESARRLADLISRKLTNSTALASVIEVKNEENVRRYCNPIREPTELCELDPRNKAHLFKALPLDTSKNTNHLAEVTNKQCQKDALLTTRPSTAGPKALLESSDDKLDAVVVLV
ncbi:protein jagged-2, putative [Ixodes scapularis]|uniref:Delta-like protein n=1 Tax=Ixodes scapularis TaxID=6945 RepID=B7PW69_IXOSC|nr:protein jagged-2, putative [Ixodes scapularis]|eukprot:XP_002409386.1 protein jagged-2, putative [Ixodes scapularis]